MHEGAFLRKQFLDHFDRKLIPWAVGSSAQPARLIRAGLPLPEGRPLARPLPLPPLPDTTKVIYPMGKRWPEAKMHCIGFPYVACILDGEADLRVGVTQSMAKKNHGSTADEGEPLAGGYALTLVARDCLLIPPGVPYSTGESPHWERPDPQLAHSQIIWMHFLPVGALIHTCATDGEQHANSYSLIVDNPNLLRMMELLLEELRERRDSYETVAHALWLAVLRRLRGDLASSMPALTDGLHSRFPAERAPEPGAPEQGARSFTSSLQSCCDFIQLRLHEPLSPAVIASNIAVTPTQLNRLFRKHFNQSVMQYVTGRRVETARLLLTTSDLSMQEIAALVGYLQASHFSQAFRAAEGISPLKYRQLSRSRGR